LSFAQLSLYSAVGGRQEEVEYNFAFQIYLYGPRIRYTKIEIQSKYFEWGAFDSAKNHKRQRRKRQSVTAKREKSQTPKLV